MKSFPMSSVPLVAWTYFLLPLAAQAPPAVHAERMAAVLAKLDEDIDLAEKSGHPPMNPSSPTSSFLRGCVRLLALTVLCIASLRASPAALWDLDALEAPPKVFACEAIHSSDDRIRALYFEGAPHRGNPTRVFAWLGVPRLALGEKAPGIILLHGGGGTAFESWVQLWVDRGYAAIAIDHFGSLPHPADAKVRPRNPDGGPPGGSLAFGQLGEPLRDQWPFQAVTAAVRAHSLLRAEPGVDPARIGVTGISWGGYLTCVVAGLDPRLRFAIPVYGCGHYADTVFAGTIAKRPAAESALWFSQWDTANYLSSGTAPMLWVTGTNDHFFWLPAWQQSYRQLSPDRRTLALRVAMPHGHPPAGDPPEVLAFADSVVRGATPLAIVEPMKRDGEMVTAAYRSSRTILRAELNYCVESDGPWEPRKWLTLPATLTPSAVTARLPANASVYFLNLIDDRGCLVSTEHAFVTSAPVKRSDPIHPVSGAIKTPNVP
jgi:dienelactone hydrolase